MTLHVTELNPETMEKLGIRSEPSIKLVAARHLALGKVLKAIAGLEQDNALEVLLEARRSLVNQGAVLSTDNSYVPPIGWTIQVVARIFQVSVLDMKRRSRSEELVRPRQVAMYLLNMAGYTLVETGQALGGRTPATVSHGFQRIAELLSKDKKLAEAVALIKEELS